MLSAGRHHLYRGWLKHTLQGTRIGDLFSRSYWTVFTTFISQQECSVADTQAVFKIDNRIEYERITNIGDEEPVLSDLLGRLNDDDVFFDIGANIGLYSCLVGKSVPNGKVISFEPHPNNLEKLRKNLSANRIRGKALQLALSDTETVVQFNLGENKAGIGKSSISAGNNGKKQSVSKVHTVPGDTIIERGAAPIPSVIKVDVEGAEGKVLSGLHDTLAESDCRLVYCEIHHDEIQKFDSTVAEIHQQLREAGFELTIIHERDSTSFLRGTKYN